LKLTKRYLKVIITTQTETRFLKKKKKTLKFYKTENNIL
jgi:hypothetical protein